MTSRQTLKKFGLLGSLYLSQFMPFWFLYQALPVLLRQQGTPLEAIGLLPLVSIAVSFKFLWAPLIDRYSFTRWGHYRFWIIVFQLWIVVITGVCSLLNLETQLPLILLGLALIGVGCASQDIATDALAVRLLKPKERGIGNAVQGVGGSLGRMIGGGGMLILLNRSGWTFSLLTLAAIMLVALLPVIAYREPRRFDREAEITASTSTATRFRPLDYFKIFLQFCQQPGMGLWLAILGLYAAAHNLSATMFTPLLVDVGLSIPEIGALLGVFGAGMTVLGTLTGGLLISLWGRKQSLLTATGIAFLGLLSYFWPAFGFTQLPILYGVISLVFFSLGMMGTVVFTIMMDRSRWETAGADYTIQTSLIGIGGILSAALSGFLADAIGYRGVFAMSVLLMLGCITLVANRFTPTIHHQPSTISAFTLQNEDIPIQNR